MSQCVGWTDDYKPTTLQIDRGWCETQSRHHCNVQLLATTVLIQTWRWRWDSEHHSTWRERDSDQATMNHRTGRSETWRYRVSGPCDPKKAPPYLSRSRSRWWCDAHHESTYWLHVTAAAWLVGRHNLSIERTHTHDTPTATVTHTNTRRYNHTQPRHTKWHIHRLKCQTYTKTPKRHDQNITVYREWQRKRERENR